MYHKTRHLYIKCFSSATDSAPEIYIKMFVTFCRVHIGAEVFNFKSKYLHLLVLMTQRRQPLWKIHHFSWESKASGKVLSSWVLMRSGSLLSLFLYSCHWPQVIYGQYRFHSLKHAAQPDLMHLLVYHAKDYILQQVHFKQAISNIMKNINIHIIVLNAEPRKGHDSKYLQTPF